MPTWQDARDKVRRDLWRPGSDGVPDATVDEAIHAACLEIEAVRRWMWLEVTRLSDPFGGKIVNLPPDCGQIRSATLVYPNGNRTRLSQDSVAIVRDLSEDTTPSTPGTAAWFYARTDQDLLLDCSVENGSRIELVYLSETPDRLEDAIALDLVNTVDRQFQAVCAHAAATVALTWLKDEAEAQRQMLFYQRRLEAMEMKDDAEQRDSEGTFVRGDTYYQDLARGKW